MPSHHRRILPALTTLALAGAAFAGVPAGTDPLVPERLMFRVTDAARLAAFVAAAQQQFSNVAVVDQIPNRPIYMLRYTLAAGQDAGAAETFCAQQTQAGNALWAELNYEGQSAEGKTDSFWLSQFGIGPDLFADQYAFPLIGLPQAHQRSLGQRVLIAVLDTGVDGSHPAFGGTVRGDGVSFVATGATGAGDAGDGADDDGDGLVDEQVGHGTFVAGLIHAVAPQATILPIAVLNSDGVGDLFGIAKGMAHAIDAGADVINMSLGSTYSSVLLSDMVREADDAGAVVVGAMGNFARENPEEFPASMTGAVGVCATDDSDHLAGFSNWNPKAKLSAPGTTAMAGPGVDPARALVGPVPGGGWAAWKGTSFSTALVSGAAALVRAQHPTWPDAQVDRAHIAREILAALEDGSVDIDALNPGFHGLIGAGRLHAGATTLLAPPAPRLGDIDGDGTVGGADIGALLGDFGAACGAGCAGDLNRDGRVDGADIGLLLGNWG
ncbi:MAG: S8 family serine peptidase [Phycisphaerales bacterium]